MGGRGWSGDADVAAVSRARDHATDLGPVHIGRSGCKPESVQHKSERAVVVDLVSSCREDEPALSSGPGIRIGEGLGDEAGLADPGLTAHEHRLGGAGRRRPEHLLEARQFLLTAHKRDRTDDRAELRGRVPTVRTVRRFLEPGG